MGDTSRQGPDSRKLLSHYLLTGEKALEIGLRVEFNAKPKLEAKQIAAARGLALQRLHCSREGHTTAITDEEVLIAATEILSEEWFKGFAQAWLKQWLKYLEQRPIGRAASGPTATMVDAVGSLSFIH